LPPIRLRLLGRVEITDAAHQSVELTSKKALALLAYLLRHSGEPVQRDRLAGLLWTDTDNEFARTNLRQSLAVLRKALKHDATPSILNEGSSIRLAPGTLESDVLAFEAACDDGSIVACERAVELYRGKFLADIDLEPEAIQDWLLIERRRFEDRFLVTAQKLLTHYEQTAADDRVQLIADRLLATDPVDESAHRALMRIYASQSRRAAIVRQFDVCRDTLHSRLDVAPSQATRDLYRQLIGSVGEPLVTLEAHQRDVTVSNEVDTKVIAGVVPAAGRSASGAYRAALPLALVVIAVLGGLMLMRAFSESGVARPLDQIEQPAMDTSAELVAPTVVELRARDERPAIAVLPFRNLGKDAEQDYFSDGLSEDLVTDLSRVSGLRITAWSSSVGYRDSAPDIAAIANALGVRYLLLGSVRKFENRVRVNVQLVDAETRIHRWAERYDREISDVFLLQDEIARTIVGRLSVDLTAQEQDRLEHSLRVDADAYDLLLRGLAPLRQLNQDSSAEARRIMQRVVEIDPSYARAWANLALTYAQDVNLGFSDTPDVALKRGFEAAARARDLDPSLPQLHFSLSMLNTSARRHDDAIIAARQAIASDPNYADGYGALAQAYLFDGQLTPALNAINTAKWLNPRFTFTYLWIEGQVYLLGKEHERARAVFEEVNERNPAFVFGRLMLISTYGHLDQLDDAEWELAELLTLRPGISQSSERIDSLYRRDEHTRHYLEGLRLGGLDD